jgi:hypothetical protein
VRAPECRNIFLLADTRLVDTKLVPVMEADAKKIGISFKVHTINGAYPTLQTPSKLVAISERPGWGKDYADALTFFTPLFDGRTIIPNGNTNYSLVGITPATAKEVGVKGSVSGVPSVDNVTRITSKNVTKYAFDQFATTPAYAHMAVK